MPRTEFTRQLAQHVPCPPAVVDAETFGAALDCVFANNPPLTGYVLDDQGNLRKHVAVFVDGQLLRQRDRLNEVPLEPDSQIFVMQALSGG
jgi:molybdopterin synthase sulfur carrier subunit